jgi:hypothetical protein
VCTEKEDRRGSGGDRALPRLTVEQLEEEVLLVNVFSKLATGNLQYTVPYSALKSYIRLKGENLIRRNL